MARENRSVTAEPEEEGEEEREGERKKEDSARTMRLYGRSAP